MNLTQWLRQYALLRCLDTWQNSPPQTPPKPAEMAESPQVSELCPRRLLEFKKERLAGQSMVKTTTIKFINTHKVHFNKYQSDSAPSLIDQSKRIGTKIMFTLLFGNVSVNSS